MINKMKINIFVVAILMLFIVPTVNGNSNTSITLVDYWVTTIDGGARYSLYHFNDIIAIETNYNLKFSSKHNLTLMSVSDGKKLSLPNKLQKILNKEASINCDIQYSDDHIFIVNDYNSIAIYNFNDDSVKIFKTKYPTEDIYVINKHIIITSYFDAFCYDFDDFRKEWEYRTGDYVSGVCFFDNNAIFACGQAGKLACVDLNTGNELWKIDKLGSAYYMGCALSNDKILAFNSGKVECYDKVGKLLWSTDNLYSYFFFAVDDKEIILNNTSENKVSSLNAADGSILWEFKAKDEITSLIGNSKHLLVSTNSNLYILDKNNGTKLDEYDIIMFALGALENKYFIQKEDKIKCMKFRPSQIKLINNSNAILDQDNDQYFMDNPLSIISQTSFVEVKSLIGLFGGTCNYDKKAKSIVATLKNDTKDITIEMQIGTPTATLNGKQVQIDPKNSKITPIIINGRTMVPLRFLAESLGCKVEWKADTKEIIVTYQP